MPLSPRAQSLWDGIREKFIEAEYPGHRVWGFSPKDRDQRKAFGELQAHGLIEPFGNRDFRLTQHGVRILVGAESPGVPLAVHHGDIVQTKISSTVSNSVVGSNAVGPYSSAEGTAISGDSNAVTRERHRAAISDAQTALIQDQDRLDALDSRLFDGLTQFLRIARTIEVEQKELAEVQRRMKETLDEVWAKQQGEGLRPRLPDGTNVLELLSKIPAMIEVAKALAEG